MLDLLSNRSATTSRLVYSPYVHLSQSSHYLASHSAGYFMKLIFGQKLLEVQFFYLSSDHV